MASVNKVILVGNLGRDPEMRTFNNGNKIATVRIATTEYYKDRQTGERRELTEWHTVIFSDRFADVAERYLRKGSSIYVEGKLRTRSWDDQQSGQKRYATEIRADVMQMLGGKADGQQRSGDGYQQGGQGYNSQGGYARQSASSGNRNGGYPKPQRPAQSAPAVNDLADEEIPF